MSGLCPQLNVKYGESGVCDSLAENTLGVGLESGIQLFFGGIYIYPDALNAHFFEGEAEKVDSSAVKLSPASQMFRIDSREAA